MIFSTQMATQRHFHPLRAEVTKNTATSPLWYLNGTSMQETHKPEQKLRFTTTTTTHGHRVPTEPCPTGPVVFCGNETHSLPLAVCSMITRLLISGGVLRRVWRLTHTADELYNEGSWDIY